MSNFTIAGNEIQQLPQIQLSELNGNCWTVVTVPQSNGRFKTGKVKLSDLNSFLSSSFVLPADTLTKNNSLVFIDFSYPGELSLNTIFGNFESTLNYEVQGVNIYLNSAPNGAVPTNHVELSLYSRTDSITFGETITSALNTQSTTKYFFTKPLLTANKKYGVKITYLKTIAPVKDLSVQLILKHV